MKKLFFLFTTLSLLIFSACNSSDEYGEGDRGQYIAQLLYHANAEQIKCNLDPFWLALRLNSLMFTAENYEGGAINIEDSKLSRATSTLLGKTSFTYDEDGVFTLRLSTGGTDDMTRSGTVTIETGDTILTPGNTWIVNIPKSANYTVSGNELVDLYVDSYRITCSSENVWKASISGLISTREGENGKVSSDWSGTITIEQKDFRGDQGSDKFLASSYTVRVESTSKIVTMYLSDTFNVKTSDPLFVNAPKCGFYEFSSGTMTTRFAYSGSDIMDFGTATLTENTNKICEPTITYKYYGSY